MSYLLLTLPTPGTVVVHTSYSLGTDIYRPGCITGNTSHTVLFNYDIRNNHVFRFQTAYSFQIIGRMAGLPL